MRKLLVIAGATASGKSALALKIAQEIPSEIISMDSVQVYRGLDIGSAKPSLAERARVPHHLIDICEPSTQYHAAHFVRDAERLIDRITEQRKLPLVVGGTTMYLTALIHGLAPRPPSDKALRATLETEDNEVLFKRLAVCDPTAHRSLNAADRLRVIRALECALLGGSAVPDLQTMLPRYDVRIIVPVIDRAVLYQRINTRVLSMIERGLINEVATIAAQYGKEAPALRAIGYAQVITESEHHAEKVVDMIQQATRRYAKRQLTYLRNEPPKKGWRNAQPHGALQWGFEELSQQISTWQGAECTRGVEIWPIDATHLVN